MTMTQTTTFGIGDRLRKARELAGLDKAELADAMGVHRDTVARYETGARPKKPVLMAWSAVTGVDLAWLEGSRMIDDAVEALRSAGVEDALRAIEALERATGLTMDELSRLRESNSRPFHYKVNFAHQSLPDDLQNRPCPVCGAPLVWGVCTAVHAGDLALAA